MLGAIDVKIKNGSYQKVTYLLVTILVSRSAWGSEGI